MKLVFATGNRGKLREAMEILGSEYELLSPADLGICGEAEETGDTFAENSYLKAKYLWDRIFPAGESDPVRECDPAGESAIDGVIADDSGLEVEALGGAPGIYSARYAGDAHDFNANTVKLLSALREVGAETPESRSGRFRCIVTLLLADGEPHYFSGDVTGHIALSPAGCGGFGYDPVFIPSDDELAAVGEAALSEWGGRTLAEIPEELKNRISHRYKALMAMSEALSASSF